MRIETIVADIMMVVLVGGTILLFPGFSFKQAEAANEIKTIKLPPPIVKGKISLEETIKKRRSERDFQDGKRGPRYVQIEVGHVGENICLQVVALGLGTVTIGAFWDEEVSRELSLPRNYKPLYVLPVGYVK